MTHIDISNAPAYVINLPHRADRMELFTKEAQKVGIKARRLAASPGGAAGATKSHLEIVRIAKRNRLPFYIVFEDDAVFADNFLTIFNNAREIPDDWDAIYLGASYILDPVKRITESVVKSEAAYTLHAVVFHEKFYNKLISIFDSAAAQNIPCDVALSNEHKNYNIYGYHPQIVFQRPGMSDITGKFEDYSFTLGAKKHL